MGVEFIAVIWCDRSLRIEQAWIARETRGTLLAYAYTRTLTIMLG